MARNISNNKSQKCRSKATTTGCNTSRWCHSDITLVSRRQNRDLDTGAHTEDLSTNGAPQQIDKVPWERKNNDQQVVVTTRIPLNIWQPFAQRTPHVRCAFTNRIISLELTLLVCYLQIFENVMLWLTDLHKIDVRNIKPCIPTLVTWCKVLYHTWTLNLLIC